MNAYKKSLCSTCIHVDSCGLTSNKILIWSCSEFDEQEVLEERVFITTINDFDTIKQKQKQKQELALI
ncbi:hypothetical protein [Tenacibaculum aestuariivivum]|uniref:hypothetical protein n=1 Tax=Tenacibaculum aestuariivivum TaxID=2006131 RepID=UPI003AB5E89D